MYKYRKSASITGALEQQFMYTFVWCNAKQRKSVHYVLMCGISSRIQKKSVHYVLMCGISSHIQKKSVHYPGMYWCVVYHPVYRRRVYIVYWCVVYHPVYRRRVYIMYWCVVYHPVYRRRVYIMYWCVVYHPVYRRRVYIVYWCVVYHPIYMYHSHCTSWDRVVKAFVMGSKYNWDVKWFKVCSEETGKLVCNATAKKCYIVQGRVRNAKIKCFHRALKGVKMTNAMAQNVILYIRVICDML